MAVKVQQVLEILEQIAPPELACSWDNVGLLVDAGCPVTSIMAALDITADVVRDAAESGCELIVSHHPVIFDPLRRVTAEDVPAMLLQNGISAICMHTNLDAAPGGVNDVLADLLRIENRRDFADNCGRIGTLNVPTTAQQLAETCSRMLHTHCKFVEADHPVEKLAGRRLPGDRRSRPPHCHFGKAERRGPGCCRALGNGTPGGVCPGGCPDRAPAQRSYCGPQPGRC